MDRRALIAIVLCGLIWAGWAAVYYPQQAKKQATPTGTEVAGETGTPGETSTGTSAVPTPTDGSTPIVDVSPTPAPTPAVPVEIKTFKADNIVVRLTSEGARPADVVLPGYVTSLDEDEAEKVVLFEGDLPKHLEPLAPRFDLAGTTPDGNPTATNIIPADARFEVVEDDEESVTYRWSNEAIALTRSYRFEPDEYRLLYEETLENVGQSDVNGQVVLSIHHALKQEVESGGLLRMAGRLPDQFSPTGLIKGRIQRKPPKVKKKKDEDADAPFKPLSKTISANEQVTWFGVDDRYFLAAAVPTEPTIDVVVDGDGAKVKYTAPTEQILGGTVARQAVSLAPGQSQSYQYLLFLGPKDYDALKAQGAELEKSLNMGRFLTPIATMLLVALRWFQGWLGNWGLAIILLTLIMKGLLLPLTHKSMKMMRENSQKMAKLNPDIKRLKEKYSDPSDKDKLNQETMALFQKHGVNPLSTFGGCIPMALQMPIWFALYRVLYSAIDLRQAPLVGWVQDLAAPDPYYILPLALGVVFFAQQRIMPQTATPGNEAQMKMMKWIFPIMFTFIMLNLPSGLVLYIFVNSLLSVGQSLYINKTMPTPAAAAPAKT